MGEYFKAGARLVGVGNAIVPLPALQSGDREAVLAHARTFLA
jgi:hypothetical protein